MSTLYSCGVAAPTPMQAPPLAMQFRPSPFPGPSVGAWLERLLSVASAGHPPISNDYRKTNGARQAYSGDYQAALALGQTKKARRRSLVIVKL